MHDFDFLKWRERKQQSFDKANITLTKAGNTFNVYDKIQEAREDTEIYPTLEKYGCIDKMMLNAQGAYADFTAFKDLRGTLEQQKEAQRMFYNLPLDVRKSFNNDINQFTIDGEAWLKNKVDEINARRAKTETTTTTKSTKKTKTETTETEE